MNYRITTKRLILRKFEMKDTQDCFEFLSDRETCYLDGGYEPFLKMDDVFYSLMDKFSKQEDRYMIVLKDENKVIGTINLRDSIFRVVNSIEIGYCLSPDYRRCGYASEAIHAVIDCLFTFHNVKMITAKAYERNIASIQLLEKLGFEYEGRLHKAFQYPGREPEDLVCYYLEKNR